MSIVTINIQLLDEGIDVARPTQAEELGNGLYKILPLPKGVPSDEKWEFPPGSIVKGVMKNMWVPKINGKGTNVLEPRLVATKA